MRIFTHMYKSLIINLYTFVYVASISVARSNLKVPLVNKNNPYTKKELNKKAELELEHSNEIERKLFEARDEEVRVKKMF